MTSIQTSSGVGLTIADPLHCYHRRLEDVARQMESAAVATRAGFEPAFAVPDPEDSLWSEFFGATPLRYLRLPSYRGHRFDLLDLMGTPGTRTTKSLASNTIMARAILHARSSGRPLTIVTPTSGNKGTALRDALARAQALALPGSELVHVVMIVPSASAGKLRLCSADEDASFTRNNPVAVAEVSSGAELKEMVFKVTEQLDRRDVDHWYTLALDNYRLADTMRAFVEYDAIAAGVAPAEGARLHAHAVSSAYGLLGYELGREALRADSAPLPEGGYFLVQHLGAPDMVLHQRTRQDGPPRYTRTEPDGPFVQHSDPDFPFETDDPEEVLDATFYTRNPPTAPAMTELIRGRFGGGIVVSRRECVARFAEVREFLGELDLMPQGTAELREWSLLMLLTGVFNAIDRGLVRTPHIVLHASGSYWDAAVPPLPADRCVQIDGPAALLDLIETAS